MSTPAANPVVLKKGIVKQVLSGDSVIIRGYPKGGPPPEKQITFSNVYAPKLARRPGAGASDESRDEPWAWEAREFLRSKLIGEEVYFTSERPPNATRDYGVIYLGSDPATAPNVTEMLVQEGLVSVRRDGGRAPTPELQRLQELEETAKSNGKGKWGNSPASDHVRNIKWTQENQRNFVEQLAGKPVNAIIEHVRDGSTVRAFLVPHPDYANLVPDFQYITLMISGIRCPGFKLDAEGKPDHSVLVDYANEARYFVESRLLQREVKIVLESVNNTNFVGSILFHKGNIAEALLREGFAKCVDWSMAFMRSGADKLRAAERQAKDKRLRMWKDYQSNAQSFTGKEKDFIGTVTEVFNGDAVNVKTPSGAIKKVFLSSIRPPREAGRTADEDGKIPTRPKNFRPLYDIPYMYECREFLRKKLIGKKVQCNLDYISPARDNFPEKYCYTVTIGGQNIAELLVGKGLATVVRYRQDDDQRSSKYDELLAAENQATKSNKGMHSKKDSTPMRINDLTVDHSRIKHQYLPSWQRALRCDAIVEFIASGSRFRLYLTKDNCLVTFLLAGISCPRSSRPAVGNTPAQEGEPFGDDALNFVREKILQRDVSVHIDTTDKAATSVIGWLWIDNSVNLSVLLVEEGLASVHFSAEKTEYYRQLKTAEDSAKAKKKNIWANYVEEVKEEEVKEEDKDDKVAERKVNQEKVVVTEVTPEMHFYAQHTDQGAKLETLMSKLRKEFQDSPPLAGAFTPKRNDLCAAQFSEDNEWYRAKVEKVQGQNATILYVDYGNKEVLSGDSVIIRGYPKGGPPPEKQITFSNVYAPKLARRPGAGASDESRDEPWAWEAREFLRSKLIGEEVYFTSERPPNATRDYGVIYLGSDPATAPNVTEMLVQEGLVSVRRDGGRAPTPELQRLQELEETAKSNGKGKWGNSPASDHVRNIKWTQENQRNFVEQLAGKPVNAIIEHVRDGSTVRAFLVPHPDYANLVPDFQYITLMISGIRCPGFKLDAEGKPDHSVLVDYANEARYFVESRLLQREVKIVLESVNNTNFVGSILFHKGNIAEALLREGFAKCVDWSMAFMRSGADKLRAAERQAKDKRLRMWKDYQSNAQSFTGKEKDFIGTVTEVFNGDAVNVKTPSGAIKKVFLSSIRPPREAGRTADEDGKIPTRPKNFRPLYDIPYMYECREFLRKKLIGKKVQCNLDYISPARDNFPEKYCYTVTIGGQNIAELLVGKGLATVVRYRQDDDQRSSKYDELLAAENQATKSNKGMHSKKDSTPMRINDLTVDHSRIKHQYLPSWQRALRCDAIVEFIASGSRFRLYLTKDNCLVTFLLAGISCPRSSRPAVGNTPAQEGEPFGDDALNFVREKILQRDVSVHIDTTDKAATSVIGWLWIDNSVNLSVLLVEEGLASVHFSAEKTEYYRQLKTAEDSAKAKKKNIWANYVEEVKEEEVKEEDKDDKVAERKVNQEKVVVTEVTPEMHFYAQHTDQGAKLETLMSKLRKEFQDSPPLAGAFTPKRNDLCAAQFSEDNEWYRAKVEKVQGQNATILYVDYGNKETVPTSRLASLPPAFISDKPYANYYGLALVALPPEEDDKTEAYKTFAQDALNRNLLLNVEYKVNGQPFATLTDTNNVDIGKALIADGILLVEKRRERKLAKLVEEYVTAEKAARKDHLGVWEYGDITADDAKEFGRN